MLFSYGCKVRKTFCVVALLVIKLFAECNGLSFTLCADHHFFLEEKSDRLVSLKFGTGGVVDCADYGKLFEIEAIVVGLPFHCVSKVDEDGMNSIMKICPKIENDRLITSDILSRIAKFPSMTFPGTDWCGPGDIARSPDDLGVFSDTDKCCRAHDNCSDYIISGETKHGIKNNRIATISHCGCDEQFHDCLSKVEHSEADSIGNTFFNFLAWPCFKSDFPIVKCGKKGGLTGRQCLQYELNMSAEPIYQLFDAQLYYPTAIKQDDV